MLLAPLSKFCFWSCCSLLLIITLSLIMSPLRWPISACRSCCRCSNTPCLTCMKFLSFMKRYWHAATHIPALRLCLWTRPMYRFPLMPPWASSGKVKLISVLFWCLKVNYRNLQYIPRVGLFIIHCCGCILHSHLLGILKDTRLCLSAPTCSTVLPSLTRPHRLAAVWPRPWLSSSLAVSSPGCHGES